MNLYRLAVLGNKYKNCSLPPFPFPTANKAMKNIFSSAIIGLPSLLLTLTINPAPAMAQIPGELTQISATKQAENSPTHRKLDQGRTYFNAGKFAQAAQIWQQAANDYGKNVDTLNQALSLSYLSLAYQHLSQWEAAQTAIESSINLVEGNKNINAFEWAQILNTQARLFFHTGNHQSALATWEKAQNYYQQAEDEAGVFMSQINQAQALQGLGFYSRSKTLLENLNQQLADTEDSLIKISALRSLGINLRLIGDLTTAQEILEQSLAIAQNLGNETQIGIIWLSLGNTAMDLGNQEIALDYFQKALQTNLNPEQKIKAQLNQLRLHIKLAQWQQADVLADKLYQQLSQVNPQNASRASVYGAVNLAVSWQEMSNQSKALKNTEINQLLAQAVQSAKNLQDTQAQAYALQHWGKLYASNGQLSAGVTLTEQSLNLANQINATHISSQSAWQLGKIFKKQGKQTQAISAYSQAVDDLKTLRGDLVSINPDVQFSFRQSIEPVYRELVALLLEGNPNQENLNQARVLIESLQLAELDNFFREACLDSQTAQIDEIDTTAAVIYPIILPDRLAVIISTPGKPLSYHATNVSATEVNETLTDFLGTLNYVFSNEERLPYFQQVYDWLIKPAEASQVLTDAKTLVFVLDGKLRNLPMATLHDGEQYLIEKYNLALSIGLQLLEPQPKAAKQFNLMTGGVSEARQGFTALPGVKTEIEQIAPQASAPVLIDEEFTQASITQQMQDYAPNVVHLATHGQFGSTAEETFLLTWEDKIQVKELDLLLRNQEVVGESPIDLLVLSACQTASGDEQAVLGIAGFAIKSGARSTVATLWSVRDASTAFFMTKFYEYLSLPQITKAEALRRAQLDLLNHSDFNEPLFWAPFVMVGHWL